MKHSLITTCLLLSCTLAFGQKEVFFEPIDSANRKVRSIQGIEVSALLSMDKKYSTNNYGLFSPSGYLGYYYEKAIAPNWTLRLTAGVQEVCVKEPLFFFDYSYYYESNPPQEYKIRFDPIFKVGIEPRWYYAYKKRFATGKASLNSGWFLSFPISMDMMYNDDYYYLGHIYGDFSPKYIKSLHVLPTWGFRSAFSRHFYWEGAAGLDFSFGQYKHATCSLFPRFDYSLRLSVGYAF